MAFIRDKTVNGKRYAQVVENYRQDGKVRQRVLLHLGHYSPERALVYWPERAADADRLARLRDLIDAGKVAVDRDEQERLEQECAAKLQQQRQREDQRKARDEANWRMLAAMFGLDSEARK